MNTLEPVNNARRLNAGGENSPPGRPARRVTNSTPHPVPRHINLFSSDDPHPACSQPNLGPAILPLPRAKDFGRGGEGTGSRGRRLFLLVCLLLTGLGISTQAQNTLNVTNYGAIGDAVQFFANTVSNSAVVTTTNPIPSSAIGEVIELFGCGTVTVAPNCQDMVATIVNVVDGTNIFVSQTPQATLTNTFATYGHNNTANFQAAIAAVGNDTNDFIYIPAGTYLLMPTSYSGKYNNLSYGYNSILLNRGGINFVGAGTNATTLLSQGAWTLIGGSVWRGILVELVSPMTNNFPISFSYLTMDGGVQQGNTSIHGFAASLKNGNGWDETHHAFLSWIVTGGYLAQSYFTNVLIQHWRGEEFISIDQPANSRIGIYNCTFADGNATALNIYPAWDVRSNLFVNLFQVAEYYQQYYSFPGYFEYNVITNITGNGFAFNGGKGNNPPFYMESNVFYLSASGKNGIETTPGDNIYVIGNLFTNVGNYVISFNLGCPGYQGTFVSSNIVITANIFYNPYMFMELGGQTAPTDPNGVVNVTISNNKFYSPANGFMDFAVSYGGFTTNISFNNNDCSQFINDPIYCTTAGIGNPYPFVSTNNLYWSPAGATGATNAVSYSHGSRFNVNINPTANTILYLDDTNARSMPAGAQMLITNSSYTHLALPIYSGSSLQTPPVILPYGQTTIFYWHAATSSWSTSNKPLPPTNFGTSTLSSSGIPIGIKSLPPTNPASSF